MSSLHLYPLDSIIDTGQALVGGADYNNDGRDELLAKSTVIGYDWIHVAIDAPTTMTDSVTIPSGTIYTINDLPYPFGQEEFLEPAGGDNAFRLDMNGNGYKEIILRNNKNIYYFYEMNEIGVVNEGLVDIPQLPTTRTSQVK